MTRISARAARIAPMELAGLLRLAGSTGATDLAVGFPPGRPPAPVVRAAVDALNGDRHQYTDPAGLPALREAIAADLAASRGLTVDPDTEITVTCGATEAIFDALLTVTDPGDEVLLPEPFFEIYPGMVVAAGATPVPVRLAGADWRLDLDRVSTALTPRTRAIVVNSPHNPTGRCFDDEEIGGLLDLCAVRGVTCILDEVYDQTVFDGRRFRSPMTMPHGRDVCVLAGSLSKSLRMSGWRIGYAVAGREMTAALRRVHERTTVGASHPLQAGAAAFVSADRDELTPWFRQRRDQVTAGLVAAGLRLREPEGGWFAFADAAGLGWSSGELTRRLVTEAGVVLAPGTAFFADPGDGDGWVRVALVRDEAVTADALGRIAGFLRSATPADPVRRNSVEQPWPASR